MKSKETITMYGGILIVGLLIFLAFNVLTTIEAFRKLFGTGAIILLGVGFSLVDFAGLARIMAPSITDNAQDEASLKFVLTMIWLVAAAADFWLTMVWARMGIVANNAQALTSSGVLTHGEATWLPTLVASIEACLRIPLVFALANYGEKLFKLREHSFQRPTSVSPQAFSSSLYQKQPDHKAKTRRAIPKKN